MSRLYQTHYVPVLEKMDSGEKDNIDEYVRDFFPATSDGFVGKCGDIAAVKVSDFDDVHRRRHLESFQKSWNEWSTYDANDRNSVSPDKVEAFVSQLIAAAPKTQEEFNQVQRTLRRQLKIAVSKSQMLAVYDRLTDGLPTDGVLDQFLVKKIVRTHSGVVVITVLTSPGTFSCPKDCHYCPNEPGQPRSYLSTEPAVLRANQNGWDAVLQFWDRASTLYHNGHIIDKIEVLVLGGTWSGYPKAYQEEFIRDLFYAANAFNQFLKAEEKRQKDGEEGERTTVGHPIPSVPEGMRSRLSLEEEQKINEDAECRIIGLTLETRPDHISKGELRRLRRFGCTRVQIGIQHTDDAILEKINRGCNRDDGIRAIRLLKDGCFKVDIHLMPDLPGSSPEQDKKMFEWVLSSPNFQADQWKIYPCEVTPFSQIEEWYRLGQFIPYAERHDGQELTQLLVKVKTAVHPWIRLNRVVRDIPNPSIIAGNDKTNLRQILLSCMSKRGISCRCLRCREVKTDILDVGVERLKIREYATLGGKDYFISYETEDESKLFGFLRLRLRDYDLDEVLEIKTIKDKKIDLDQTFPELKGCGLIRELHIYGQLVGSREQKVEGDNRSQHTGFGRRLIAVAEIISLSHGLSKMAVIAGVGTRDYYRKFDYEVEGCYMTKTISYSSVSHWVHQLALTLPLRVQLYCTTTNLGTLDCGVGLPSSLSQQDQRPPVELTLKDRSGRREKKKSAMSKPDILTPLGNNYVCSIKSRPDGTALVFLDHIEIQSSSVLSKQHLNQMLSCFAHHVPMSRALQALGIIAVGSMLLGVFKWTRRP